MSRTTGRFLREVIRTPVPSRFPVPRIKAQPFLGSKLHIVTPHLATKTGWFTPNFQIFHESQLLVAMNHSESLGSQHPHWLTLRVCIGMVKTKRLYIWEYNSHIKKQVWTSHKGNHSVVSPANSGTQDLKDRIHRFAGKEALFQDLPFLAESAGICHGKSQRD